MSEANEMKSTASGSESVGAALQAATVFGASDGLISENHKAEARDREDTQEETVFEQWASFSGSSEEEEAQEESSGAGKTGSTAGVVSPSTAQGAAASAVAANVVISPDVASAASVATGVSEASGDTTVSGDADEEDTEEESDDTEESAGDEAEEASEENSDSSDSEEESASEPAVTTEETIAPVSDSDSSFEPTVMKQPIIINYAPEAVPDEAAVTENGLLLFDPLANDKDVNDDAQSFSLDSVTIVDSHGDVVSGQGNVSIIDNQLQFSPGNDFDDLAAGETATVNVRYEMSDDEGAVSESVVTITVTGSNDETDAGEIVFLGTGSEDSLIEITEATLLANASDVDGDQLSVRNLASEQGTLSDNGDGSWVFEPNAHFSGTANISFEVFDGVSGTPGSASMELTPVVDLPALTITPIDNSEMAGATGDAAGLEDTGIKLDLTAVLADTDGSESLAISITDVPEGAVLSAGEQNPDGSWSLTASDLDNLELTPPLNFNGDINLTVTAIATEVATGATASISETLTVNVLPVNDPPSTSTTAAEALSHTVNTQPTGNGATFVTLNEHAEDFGSFGTGAISLWVKLDSGHGSATLLSMADSTTRGTQSFFIAGNTTKTMTDESLTFAAMEGDTHLAMMVRQGQDYLFDDQWHHVAVVVDGIDNRMYIDGERAAVHFKDGSATTSLFTGTDIDLVNIGSLVRNGDINGTLTTNGEIAEVAIFGSTDGLNDSSVQTLMNQGPDFFTHPAGSNDLLFSTDFSGTGDTVTDTSDHGRDGTAFSGDLAPRGSFTVDVGVVEDGTLLLQEVDLLNGFSDLEGDSLSVHSVTADHGTVVDRGDGHWIFTPNNNFHGVVSVSIEVTDGTDTVVAVRTAMVASDHENSLNIAGSTFQIVEGEILGTEFSGKIVEDNGYTSLDQWLLNHEGGALSVSLNTADGSNWLAGVRLFHSDANGSAGAEVAHFSGQLAETGQGVQVFEFNDLPAGHYQLVLGNDGFDESSAGSALDYPGMVSGEHSYEVMVSGQVSVAELPRDPGQNALITGETQGQTEGILTLAVVNNEAEMIDTDNTLHYEVFNNDVRVGQGTFDFSGGVSPQNISVTFNNESLKTLTLDEVQVVFHEINSSGEVVHSQTFGFDQAAIPDGATVIAQGGDGLQGLELMELGLNYFELGFSELMDDMQGAYAG